MAKLFEVQLTLCGLNIKEGIKLTSPLPIEVINKDLIDKNNLSEGRVLRVDCLDPQKNSICFSGKESENFILSEEALVFIPNSFSKTSGTIFAKSPFDQNVLVQLKDGDTFCLEFNGKIYYLMARQEVYGIVIRRILVVD